MGLHRQIQAKYRPAAPVGAAGLYLAVYTGPAQALYACAYRACAGRRMMLWIYGYIQSIILVVVDYEVVVICWAS